MSLKNILINDMSSSIFLEIVNSNSNTANTQIQQAGSLQRKILSSDSKDAITQNCCFLTPLPTLFIFC